MNHYRQQPLKHKKKQGKFLADCEKIFFKTIYHNRRVSTTVFAASPSIHPCLSQDLTRATHLSNNQFGQHCLSSECGKAAKEIQDT
jgi:hypothetical protein